MSDYIEFTLLLGLFALAGIAIMTNIRIELWCERWLEYAFMQPFSGETAIHTAAQPKSVARIHAKTISLWKYRISPFSVRCGTQTKDTGIRHGLEYVSERLARR